MPPPLAAQACPPRPSNRHPIPSSHLLGLLALGMLVLPPAPSAAALHAGSAADPVGDTFAGTGAPVDLTGLSVELAAGDLSIRLSHAPFAGRPVGYVDLDRDADPTTGGTPWTSAEGVPRATGLGMDLYLDLFSYDDGDGKVTLFADDGTALGRVPATFGADAVELVVPGAHLAGAGRVAVAAVVGNAADATDMAPDDGAVVASDPTTVASLVGGRFQVSVSWRTGAGAEGVGHIATGADDSAVFWFFAEDNWELLVKVLDGCPLTGHYWVFFAATTDVRFDLAVTDLQAQVTKTYTNPLGQTAHTVADTAAFATCP